VRLKREAILLLARDAVLLGHVLGRLAHRLELEAGLEPRVRVAPAERRVVHGGRRPSKRSACLGIENGARVMLSTPARDGALGLAHGDHARGVGDGLEPEPQSGSP
jgi:hypothetical protein